jgi:hypothetical protein
MNEGFREIKIENILGKNPLGKKSQKINNKNLTNQKHQQFLLFLLFFLF